MASPSDPSLPQSSSESVSGRDVAMLDKTLQRLAKLHVLSSNPRLQLKNSPPFLPSLVRETSELLLLVWEPYVGSKAGASVGRPRGDEAKFLRVHVRNLQDKTERALLLFRDGPEEMLDKSSGHRRKLTKLSLLFSHMLWELKAMFPDGGFQGDAYRVSMTEAEHFWRRSFGNKCVVRWMKFKQQLQKVHTFGEGMESMALKSTIALTCADYVSVFEFDIFTKLFQPWKSLIRNWNNFAVTHPGYMAFLTYDQVVARLERHLHRPGSYIFRLSSSQMGQWAIGHVTANGDIIQTIYQNTPLHQALSEGSREGSYLFPDGCDVNPDLTSFSEPAQRDSVAVTEEQYELYCEIGSTFQLCKICTERDKDTRIQPCGHLLCQPCLAGWQKSSGHSCPYCRCDIRGTESILIQPYFPEHQRSNEEDEEKKSKENAEEDDHEDIELMVKEMEALRTVSSSDSQFPPSCPPIASLLPPKLNSASCRPSQFSQPQTPETPITRSQSHRELIKRAEFLRDVNTSSNSELTVCPVVDGGAQGQEERSCPAPRPPETLHL